MGRPIRILLVEDNEVFREALELLLGMRAEIEVVASVGDGSEAVAAVREAPAGGRADGLPPAGDGRRAGDGGRPRGASRRSPSSCLTASANAREIEALYEAGAAACLTKDQELDEIVDALRSGRRREPHRRRTRRSSSTRPPTSPTRAERFPNWRVVPLYVNFGTRASRTASSSTAHEFYERLRTLAGAADDLAADAGRLPRRLRGARRVRADPLAAHRRRSSRGRSRARAPRPRSSATAACARSTRESGLGRDRDARARDPAPPRARHDRRGGRRARRALPRASTACSSPSTRSSSSRAAAASARRRRSRASC